MARRWTGSSFRGSEAAVSAVISTILMVAVTVVLAAAAFVLIADVGGQTTEPVIPLGLRTDDDADQLIVNSAGGGANWNRIRMQVESDEGLGSVIRVGQSASGGYMDEPASTGGADLSVPVDVSTEPRPIVGGEYIEFCRHGGTDGKVMIRVIDSVANGVIGTYTFGNLHAC